MISQEHVHDTYFAPTSVPSLLSSPAPSASLLAGQYCPPTSQICPSPPSQCFPSLSSPLCSSNSNFINSLPFHLLLLLCPPQHHYVLNLSLTSFPLLFSSLLLPPHPPLHPHHYHFLLKFSLLHTPSSPPSPPPLPLHHHHCHVQPPPHSCMPTTYKSRTEMPLSSAQTRG